MEKGKVKTSMRLSENQQTVVMHDEGPLLVVAGPGSGKTRVLTERVRRLLTSPGVHFRVLALTFTNKAANEMKERLADLGDARHRAFVGTLHKFCADLLADKGKLVGVTGLPQIFESATDRKQILMEAVRADPLLLAELDSSGDAKEQGKQLDKWLKSISYVKTHPESSMLEEDPFAERLVGSYDAVLRASGAYDFEDLLLLTHKLLIEHPFIADFYSRLYRYICIDEAQDLNEAQYCVIKALCGPTFRNVLMVGDPKQSIFGFNTSSPKYMSQFAEEFGAKKLELNENYRCSKSVVGFAQSLEPRYMVEGQLPIAGEVRVLVGENEEDEASKVADRLTELLSIGHPDIEGDISPERIAVLARTRFGLLAVERTFNARAIPIFKRVSSALENQSALVDDLMLAMRLIANPADRFHLKQLAKRWTVDLPSESERLSDVQGVMFRLAELSESEVTGRGVAIFEATRELLHSSGRLNMTAAISVLRSYAERTDRSDKLEIYEDCKVLEAEWDHYLRSEGSATKSVGAFMSSIALGTSGQAMVKGVSLLTVHSAKGLEFDVVFVVGMADGVFPDYRARGNSTAMAEERRNAFVAATRSKRLLYLSYARQRTMPWGEVWRQQPSNFLASVRSS